MIKTHRWKCKQCEDKLFLRVNDSIETDLKKLTKFEAHVSRHVIKMEHEMTHEEKIEKGYNYV
jgi:hypothetical protein